MDYESTAEHSLFNFYQKSVFYVRITEFIQLRWKDLEHLAGLEKKTRNI